MEWYFLVSLCTRGISSRSSSDLNKGGFSLSVIWRWYETFRAFPRLIFWIVEWYIYAGIGNFCRPLIAVFSWQIFSTTYTSFLYACKCRHSEIHFGLALSFFPPKIVEPWADILCNVSSFGVPLHLAKLATDVASSQGSLTRPIIPAILQYNDGAYLWILRCHFLLPPKFGLPFVQQVTLSHNLTTYFTTGCATLSFPYLSRKVLLSTNIAHRFMSITLSSHYPLSQLLIDLYLDISRCNLSLTWPRYALGCSTPYARWWNPCLGGEDRFIYSTYVVFCKY
jgi:hypothetical protein